MPRRRTTSPASEFRLWYERSRPKGTGLDPAEVALRIRAFLQGSLGPAASARALRDAAAVTDAVSPDLAKLIKYNTTDDLLELGRQALERRRMPQVETAGKAPGLNAPA
ncbi:hypothetical protein [Actinomadura sp. NPDC048394]|uniref:hypothetical protein n=1 Tax=Actinomadura sp. NPDC048394 TaxID=3158223 RepID=UPI00340891D4